MWFFSCTEPEISTSAAKLYSYSEGLYRGVCSYYIRLIYITFYFLKKISSLKTFDSNMSTNERILNLALSNVQMFVLEIVQISE